MDTTTTPATFETAFATFVENCQAIIDAYMSKNFPTLPREVLSVDPGRRYMRIVKTYNGGSRCVYCFVDRTNGDVLKAESWKKPAHHARGNIYGGNTAAAMDHHGARYLR